jgi:hypothetical protein
MFEVLRALIVKQRPDNDRAELRQAMANIERAREETTDAMWQLRLERDVSTFNRHLNDLTDWDRP